MYERLAAPQASRGCLEPATLRAVDLACRHFEQPLDLPTAGKEQIGPLRELIRNSLQNADERLAARLWAGEDVVQLVHARAWVVEQLLLLAWHRIMPHPIDICLAAVGGFGRGELHPHSDVDLLILLDDAVAENLPREALECFIQLLWDAGFYLGHSVRTIAQCREEAAGNVTTATTLMEGRLLDGPAPLFRRMQTELSVEHMWTAAQFFAAKFAEQQQRHARFHETAYNLEPNIKEGPGGLRDIQMIAWVARRHFGAQTLHGLVEHGFLSETEYTDLVNDQRFLWRVRYALHVLAGRAEDRLLFDFQRQVAQRLGYTDQDSNLAVEEFMQAYYRTVMQLERLQRTAAAVVPGSLLYSADEAVQALGEEFRVRHGFLETRDDAVFCRPAALMEMFVLLAQHEDLRGVGASTIRLVRDNLYLVDDEFRHDETVNGLFLELLRQPEGVYTQLQRMNRYGVLAELIPAFGNIVGRMQYDLFHVFTVDQHTLFVVRNLRRFAYGKYRDRFPHCQSVFKRIERPELLYLAALFHDIAKGQRRYSQLGALTRVLCQRILIPRRRNDRLAGSTAPLMSRTAQRKDLPTRPLSRICAMWATRYWITFICSLWRTLLQPVRSYGTTGKTACSGTCCCKPGQRCAAAWTTRCNGPQLFAKPGRAHSVACSNGNCPRRPFDGSGTLCRNMHSCACPQISWNGRLRQSFTARMSTGNGMRQRSRVWKCTSPCAVCNPTECPSCSFRCPIMTACLRRSPRYWMKWASTSSLHAFSRQKTGEVLTCSSSWTSRIT
jgi:[protein-PII] uridylyltransferase